MRGPYPVTRRWAKPLAAIAALGLGVVLAAHRRVTTQPAPGCAADNGGLTLPPGFCAGIFADSLGAVRHMALAPNGDVLILRQMRPRGDTTGGGVLILRDANNDGRAEVVGNFGPVGGTGIALSGTSLFIDAKTVILRYKLPAGATKPTGAVDTVVRDLPVGGHQAHNFVLDSHGALYVNVGSNTNSCQEKDRGIGSKGIDPCHELETRAGIWKFSATQNGQRFSPSDRYATGIRNAMGLAWHPTEGALYATQHGRDNLFQNWAPLYDETASAEQPAEEFFKVGPGDDFGWPYCYYDTNLKHLVLAPDYDGDAKEPGRCVRKQAPLVAFPGHWAPNALMFYTGTQFPARYRDGAFIAFHGSWNRAPREQAGYKVVFVPATKGVYSGAYETFADNFANGKFDPAKADHRPTGLLTAKDGALLVTDDKAGRVYRVRYVGAR